MLKTKFKAFTLIELLVVVAIIGILAAIVLASLGQARNKAKDAAIKGEFTQIRTQAALIVTDPGISYTGLSTDPGIMKIITSVETKTNTGVTVQSYIPTDGSSFLFYVALHVGGFYCVDSTGSSIKLDTAPAATDVSC